MRKTVSVADVGEHLGGGADRGDPTFDGVEVEAGDRGGDDEFEERLAAVDEFAQGRVTFPDAQVTGVEAVGFDGDEGLGAEQALEFEGLECRLLTGGVAVEGEDHLSGRVVAEEAADDLHVFGAEGRAAGGHGLVDSGEVGGHDVGVALDDDDALGLRDRLLRQIEPVEDLVLVVERGLRGIEVLRSLVVVIESAGAEADGPGRHVLDRPDHPTAEAVVDSASAFAGQAAGEDLLVGEAGPAQMGRQGIPGFRGEPDAELSARLSGKAAAGEEFATDLPGFGFQSLGEEAPGDFVHLQQSLPAAGLFPVGSLPVLVAQMHSGLAGQGLDGFDEAELFDLLQEGEYIAGLTAAEAMVHPDLGAHRERGSLLVVERAQTLERSDACGLEGDEFPDHLVDAGAAAQFVDVLALDESGHGLEPILRSGVEVVVESPGGMVGQGGDLVDDDAPPCGVVGGLGVVGAEHRIELVR